MTMGSKQVALGPRPGFTRGDRVRVFEEHRRPWEGDVLSVKPSSRSGWWVEVRDDRGTAWAVALSSAQVRRVVPVSAEREATS